MGSEAKGSTGRTPTINFLDRRLSLYRARLEMTPTPAHSEYEAPDAAAGALRMLSSSFLS